MKLASEAVTRCRVTPVDAVQGEHTCGVGDGVVATLGWGGRGGGGVAKLCRGGGCAKGCWELSLGAADGHCIGATAGGAWGQQAEVGVSRVLYWLSLLIAWFQLCMVTGNCFLEDLHRHACRNSYW